MKISIMLVARVINSPGKGVKTPARNPSERVMPPTTPEVINSVLRDRLCRYIMYRENEQSMSRTLCKTIQSWFSIGDVSKA